MEGHNTHAGVASVAALPVKQAMQRLHIPGTSRSSFGPPRGADRQPSVHRAGRLLQDVDAVILLTSRNARPPATACRTMPRSARSSRSNGKTAHGAVNPWDGKDAVRRGRADGHRLRTSSESTAPDRIGAPHHHDRRHPAQYHSRQGPVWWFVRDASMPAAKSTYDKLVKIAEARR